MKFIIALTVIAGAVSATFNETSVSRQLHATPPPYCWLRSYARGVGTEPKLCAKGQELLEFHCYDKCPRGTSRKGVDCHSDCPKGMADQGQYCLKKQYGRGVGYPWKFGDSLNDVAMFKRCEKDNGGPGTCEKNGLVVYPKCEVGYNSIGCCICRPTATDCEKLGLADRSDVSCTKKVIIGRRHPRTCAPNEELSAGLCYKKCLKGFHGFGPICWKLAPPEWIQCGMGATKTSEECEQIKTDKILSVISLVLKISTEFSSSSEDVLKAQVDSGKLTTLNDAWSSIKSSSAVQNAMKAYDDANRLESGYRSIQDLVKEVRTTKDFVQIATSMTLVLNYTRISGGYKYQTCDKVVDPDACMSED